MLHRELKGAFFYLNISVPQKALNVTLLLLRGKAATISSLMSRDVHRCTNTPRQSPEASKRKVYRDNYAAHILH